MNRGVAAFAVVLPVLFASSLVACRDVWGISDLTYDGGPDAAKVKDATMSQDVGMDTGVDTGVDAERDVETETSTKADAREASTLDARDAGRDAADAHSEDAQEAGPRDANTSHDAGHDAAHDAGYDAGCVSSCAMMYGGMPPNPETTALINAFTGTAGCCNASACSGSHGCMPGCMPIMDAGGACPTCIADDLAAGLCPSVLTECASSSCAEFAQCIKDCQGHQ